jgi:Flp pilus assembly protein TadD
VALLGGDVEAARAAYERAAKLPMDEGTARLNTVKRLLCRWPPGPSRSTLAQLLAAPASGRDSAMDLMNLRALVERDPGRGLYHYLLARQLFTRERWGEVVDVLTRPVEESLPDARFDREQARILGASRYRLGDFDGADAEFARIESDREAGEGLRREASDWRARCAFAKKQRAP